MFLTIFKRHLIQCIKRIILHLGGLQYPAKLRAINPDLNKNMEGTKKVNDSLTDCFFLRHFLSLHLVNYIL